MTGSPSRKRRRSGGWKDLELPIGGFGVGGAWKRRMSSGEATAYEIDVDLGIVRRRGGEVVSTFLGAGEYETIKLRIPHKKGFQLHSLVCWAAHGPMPAGCTSVDHLDRGRTNNAAWNLRWASPKDQAANRNPGSGRKPMLPFERAPGEDMHEFLGFPGFAYSGPSLVVTSLGRIVRGGKLSQATSGEKLRYPSIKIAGLGDRLLHRIAWSAYHGPDEPVPAVINHRDGNTKNFAKANLEESSKSHNAKHAHDIGAFHGSKSQRQPVVIRLTPSETGDVWMYDGVNAAEFPSQHAAARALVAAGACALANVSGSISTCMSNKHAFTVLAGGVPARAWAFRV